MNPDYYYEVEYKCENCEFADFYMLPKGIPITSDGSVCKYCGCHSLKFTGKRKDQTTTP